MYGHGSHIYLCGLATEKNVGRWQQGCPFSLARTLGLGPELSSVGRARPCPRGGKPSEAEGALLPAPCSQPSAEERAPLGAGASKTNRDSKNNSQLRSSLVSANFYFHSCQSAFAAMVTNLEINHIKTLKAHLNRKVQPTVLAKKKKKKDSNIPRSQPSYFPIESFKYHDLTTFFSALTSVLMLTNKLGALFSLIFLTHTKQVLLQ